MKLERLCLFCKRFELWPATRGYSELTPGAEAEISCSKNHWSMLVEDGREEYRKNLLHGLTCPDFVLAEMPWLDEEIRKLLEL